MVIATSLIADCERFRELTNGIQILAFIEDRFRALGATHFLATGLPLPGRPIEPLLLRVMWGDQRGDRPPAGIIAAEDPILQAALRARRAFVLGDSEEDLRIFEELVLLRQASSDRACPRRRGAGALLPAVPGVRHRRRAGAFA